MKSFCFVLMTMFSLSIVVLNGCSNSSSSAPMTLSIPGIGSTFIFHHYDVDSARRMIDSTLAYDSLTVTGREMSYMGKTHVMQITSSRGHSRYFNLETNGDFSEYIQNQGRPGDQSGWFTISMAPNSKSSFVFYDSVQFGVRDTTVGVYAYLRSRVQMMAGQNFHIIDFDESEHGFGTPDGASYGATTEWYSPDVALIVGSDEPPFHLGHGWNPGYHSEVVSFHLK